MKPLLEHFEETKLKTEKNDVEIAKKNDRISKLTREVDQLRAQIESYSYKDKEIKLCEAEVRTSANLIESLKQEIQLTTKSTEKEAGDKKSIYWRGKKSLKKVKMLEKRDYLYSMDYFPILIYNM